MLKKSLALLLALGVGVPLAAAASDTLVKFKGGIGVQPVSNVSGTATNPPTNTIFPEITRNIVRGINPPGQIWVIGKLKASIKFDGRIKVNGKGLLLGGGNNVGLNANASVFATLICEAAAPFVLHNSTLTGVALAPNGDFHIDDVLVPPAPATCASPVLLIRNVAGAWFAAGIQDLDTDHDD